MGGVLRGARGLDAQQGPARDGGDEQADQGEPEQVPDGGEAAGDESAETGADHAPEAEGCVEAGHDRPAQGGHEIDGGAVERHVEAAVGRAEQQQDGAERDRGVGQGRQRDAEGEQDGAGDGDAVGAVAPAQAAGQHHGDHRAGRHAEEGEAEGAGGGTRPFLDRGDADDPSGEDEAVESEEDGEGDAEPAEVAATAPHGAVRPGFVYLRHKIRVGGRSVVGKGVRLSGPGPSARLPRHRIRAGPQADFTSVPLSRPCRWGYWARRTIRRPAGRR
ncbi:hypothetical protein SGRIM119S_03481 [Streptomyces griseorubiginosus]